jgi:hypothetical protein
MLVTQDFCSVGNISGLRYDEKLVTQDLASESSYLVCVKGF